MFHLLFLVIQVVFHRLRVDPKSTKGPKFSEPALCMTDEILRLGLTPRLPRYQRGGKGSGPESFLKTSRTPGPRGMSPITFATSSGISGSGPLPTSFLYSL